MNVVDWNKLLNALEKYGWPKNVCLGLGGDWFWTAANIIKDGVPIKEHNAYVTSSWAWPEMRIELDDDEEICISVGMTADKGERAWPSDIWDKVAKAYAKEPTP